jgi:biotin carboxyl carrier protein
MKYQVNIQGKTFEVKIENLHTQPIVTSVDGEIIEVWVEQNNGVARIKSEESPETSPAPVTAVAGPQKAKKIDLVGENKTIRAPIPGTIISVSARAGNEVSIGQELCVLEAMKMKNAIRSPRKGIVAAVHVSPGQTVQHRAVLVEFTD